MRKFLNSSLESTDIGSNFTGTICISSESNSTKIFDFFDFLVNN
jgi:hypothetical protein